MLLYFVIVRGGAVTSVTPTRLRGPTLDVISRVWKLHDRLGHTHLHTLAHMVRYGRLGNVDVTSQEILSVARHQHCLACALAKWRRLNATPGSGIHPNLTGHSWSVDYKGPYAQHAIGGYTGALVFVELSCGYMILFLVRHKSELMDCICRVAKHCTRFGHTMRALRTDMGTVENSERVYDECMLVNKEIGDLGVSLLPANVEMQQQNPVERHIQTLDNNDAALMVNQDLLSGAWWGMSKLATVQTMNAVTNTLCPDSTPDEVFEDRHTDVSRQFRYPFGQAVIATRTGPSVKTPGRLRNELGVVVGMGNPHNGATLVWFPERGTHLVSPRFHMHALTLGAKRQMSLEEGKRYMPVRGLDGCVHLVTRGDTGILARQFVLTMEEEDAARLPTDPDDYVRTSSIDSSILSTTHTTTKPPPTPTNPVSALPPNHLTHQRP